MNRRDAIQHISLLLGGTIIGANAFLTGCKTSSGEAGKFTDEDIAYLDEIAETILPATKTPGAKAAKVGQFMTIMVNDCYEEKDQKVFRDGLGKLNDAADKKFDNKFMKLSAGQRRELLIELDKEQKQYQSAKKADDPNHYFRQMKELTMLGYFTSEIGCKQARRYVESPGKYDGCIPYKKGDTAWAI